MNLPMLPKRPGLLSIFGTRGGCYGCGGRDAGDGMRGAFWPNTLDTGRHSERMGTLLANGIRQRPTHLNSCEQCTARSEGVP